MAKANGSFQITSFNEDTYEDRGDKAKLTHAWGDQTFSGDIEGDGQVHWLMSYRPDGTATYVGLQRSKAPSVGAAARWSSTHPASSTEQHHAANGRSFRGPGSDGLKGITGSGTFEAPGGPKATYELDYELG